MGANSLPIQSQNGRPTKELHSAASNRRKRARSIRKVQPLRVPSGKIIKAQAMLIEGHSMREVSRNLHMSAHTVAKVVKTQDFVRHIKKMQERLFAFAPDALRSFHNQLKTDGHLAYVFLKDLGIMPSPEAMAQFLNAATSQTETGEERQARLLASVLIEARNNYGVDFDFDAARDSEHQKAKTSQPILLRK
jgi:hypothetical protein